MSLNLLQVAEPIMLEPEPGMSFKQIFMAGGWHFMAIITLVLVCALFAAWKAPAWVKPLGKIVARVGDKIPFSVYCSGFKIALIAPIYSIIVYGIVTITDMIRRPRI